MPAIGEMQAGFFRGLDEKFAPVKVNWQVAVNSLAYPDVPNHEEGMPNYLKSRQAIDRFPDAHEHDARPGHQRRS